jgi:septal ring factor EnvC (AmiA/AmiB activator)
LASAAPAAPTVFSNIIANEEAQELRTYARIIEQQNRKVAELERHQRLLEAEVAQRTAEGQRLEASLERREREWRAENDGLRAERDRWRDSVQAEQTKNERLLALVNRKDSEIQRMIQRKVCLSCGMCF